MAGCSSSHHSRRPRMAYGQALSCLLLVAALGAATAQQPQPTGTLDYALLAQQYQYASVRTCENPSNPPFLKTASTSPRHFANVQNWKAKQWSDYVTKDLKDKWIPSAVFLGIGAASLLILLVWRLVVSCSACCGKAPHQHFAAQAAYSGTRHSAQAGVPLGRRQRAVSWWRTQNSSTAMMWLKPFVLLLAMVSLLLIIYGLSQARKGLADQAWKHVDKATTQVNVITLQVEDVLSRMSTVSSDITDLQNAVNDLGQQLPGDLAAVVAAVVSNGDDIKTQIASIVQQYSPVPAQVRADVVGKVNSVRTKHYQTVRDMDKGQYIATVVLLSLGLVLLTTLLLGMALNMPGLFTLSALGCHVLLVLYFVVGLLMAMALAAGNDVCPATEVIVKAVVPNDRTILLNYYMFGVGGTVQQVFKASGIVDITNLEAQAAAAQAVLGDANTIVQQLPRVQQLQALQTSTAQLQQSLDAAVGSKDTLLQLSSFQAVNPLYMGAKSYACCDARDTVLHLWSAFTGAAWVMLVLAWLCNALITQYDRAPGSWNGACNGCCGWHRLGPFTQQQVNPAAAKSTQLMPPASTTTDVESGRIPAVGSGAAAFPPYSAYPAAGAQAYPMAPAGAQTYAGQAYTYPPAATRAYPPTTAPSPFEMSQYPLTGK